MSLDQDNVQDEITGYIDEQGEDEDTVVPGGSSPDYLALPDEAPRVEVIQQVVTLIAKALADERMRYADLQKSAVRVTTNLSGQVLFARFTVPAVPIQICREKDLRGDTTIVNLDTTNPVYIGLHSGIIAAATDVATVAAGAARTIRTRNALWAISGGSVAIDVQEEFD